MTSEKRADEIFRELCDLAPSEQRASLDARCGDDHALRAAAEALLAEDAKLSEAESNESRGASTHSLLGQVLGGIEPSDEPALEHVGPFVVDRLIGRGGMGLVYEARDTRLDRRVALKVLPETFLRDPCEAREVRARSEAPRRAQPSQRCRDLRNRGNG